MVGKKKRNHPDIEDLLARPWCYYCERDFDDLKILISHQKAKHFKCERCGRRLNTAGGLSVHMNQVHKEQLLLVENSLPNRAGLEVEIFGMEGIPEDVVQAHNQRIITGYYHAEAERRAATGNPTPGGNNAGGPSKKAKFESPADLKKRLAEHKARKAELAAAGDSGGNTPLLDTQSPMGQTPPAYNASPFTPSQATYGNTQGAGYGSFSQEPYAQSAVSYSQPYPQQPAYSGPPGAAYPNQYPPAPSPQQPQQQQPQYPAQSFPPGYQPPPGYQAGPPGFNAGAPPGAFNGGFQGPPSVTPPAPNGLPSRPPSLPPAPGLPQRPAFAPPPVAPYQMQQMHQGAASGQYPIPGQQPGGWGANNWNGQDNSAMSSAPPPPGYNGAYPTNAPGVNGGAIDKIDMRIDDILRKAEAGIPAKPRVDVYNPPPVLKSEEPAPVPVPEAVNENDTKKTKKDKATRMIYSDTEFSPEERMAKMPRYAFVPEQES